MFFTVSGSLASQPLAWYRSVMSAAEPSSTTANRSWSGCSCQESGGSPPCSRVESTVRALEPPPPDTAEFLYVTPGAAVVNASSSTFRAAASEPEVHQENTSKVPPPASPVALPSAPGLPVEPAPPHADSASTLAAVTASAARFNPLTIFFSPSSWDSRPLVFFGDGLHCPRFRSI